MKRLLLITLGLVAVGLGVVKMAELTMTRNEPVPADSRMAIVVEAQTKGQTYYSRLQMTRSLFMICRLQADTTVLDDDFRVLEPNSFRFLIEPALDESDQRQLHGCLEDARIDQLQVEVVAIERVPGDGKEVVAKGPPDAAGRND